MGFTVFNASTQIDLRPPDLQTQCVSSFFCNFLGCKMIKKRSIVKEENENSYFV